MEKKQKKKLEDYEWLRVRYIGDYYKVSLIKGKEYNAMVRHPKWYTIYDESEEYYIFPADMFEVLGKGEPAVEHYRESLKKDQYDPNDVVKYPDVIIKKED